MMTGMFWVGLRWDQIILLLSYEGLGLFMNCMVSV
jgi:hypothetical protein